jgi:hypothetical protein
MKQFLTWCPRLLTLAFALFISAFAADAFSAGGTIWQQTGDFLMHLIPTAVTLGFLWIAWRYRVVGGLLFILWGLVFTINFGTHRSAALFLLFSMPLLLSGFLFLFSQLYVKKTPPANHSSGL